MRSESWRELEPSRIADALHAQQGDLLQRPPAYSARKIGGERAYRLARAGQVPELEASQVHVYALDVTRVEPPEVDFTVRCSAGTYVRAIARDAGDVLGVGAHLTALRRTAIGELTADRAVEVGKLDDEDERARVLLSPLEAMRHLPRIDVSAADAQAIRHGRTVAAPPTRAGTVVLASEGELLAIADADGSWLRPRKVFGDA